MDTTEVARNSEGIAAPAVLDPKKTYQLCCVCGLLFEEHYLSHDLEHDTAICDNHACQKKYYAESTAS